MLAKQLLASFTMLALAVPALCQQPTAAQETVGKPSAAAVPKAAGIAWFGQWTEGLKEAKKTGRPILLVSAAPHCRGVSGIW